jgi:pimeloyl-ACP methyl ester carboxylesterase
VPALEERFTYHEGRPLRYLIGGSGPPILLCHGFLGSAENFADWFDALLPRRTIVALDLPGFGRSAPLNGAHIATSMARAALTAADHAGIEEFDVAGLCLGTPVALAVQRSRPQSVRSMVLHTPLLAPRLVRRRFHFQAGVMLSRPVYPVFVWCGHQRAISDLYKRIMVEGSDVDPRAAQANFDNQMRSNPRAAQEWLHDGLKRNDLAQLRGSTNRVLILTAAEDRIVDAERLSRAVGDIDRIDLAVIEQGGHAWTETMLHHQRELIAAFLDGRPLPLPQRAVASAA